jgi:hypothetical protein
MEGTQTSGSSTTLAFPGRCGKGSARSLERMERTVERRDCKETYVEDVMESWIYTQVSGRIIGATGGEISSFQECYPLFPLDSNMPTAVILYKLKC